VISDLHSLRDQHYNATVTFVREITSDLRILRIQSNKGERHFEPGQFAILGLLGGEECVVECKPQDSGKLLLRAYSMSHPILDHSTRKLYTENEIDFFEFYVSLMTRKNVPAEEAPVLTPRLFSLREGSRLHLGKISGHYRLKSEELAKKKHLIFCATGTGEAPHNAMVWKLLSDKYEGRLTAVVSVRKWADLGYCQTYDGLTRRFPNLSYVPIATREPDTPKRYIQDLIENGELEERIGEPLSRERHAFYLCGNPAMIGIPKTDSSSGQRIFPPGKVGMIELLEKKGFTSEEIHYEKYW